MIVILGIIYSLSSIKKFYGIFYFQELPDFRISNFTSHIKYNIPKAPNFLINYFKIILDL